MRLYLSSFRNGDSPRELLRLLGKGRKTALIGNAMDMVEEEGRSASMKEEVSRLESIGLMPTEIDLREHFGKKQGLKEKLSEFDFLWVRGGNTFILRRAFKQSGFDNIAKEMLRQDSIVYGGYSAGICLLAPTLLGLDLVDNPITAPAGYDAATIWDGLGVLSYSIAPHYKSDHPESVDIDKVVAYFAERNIPFKTLRDGEVIVVDGDREFTC